LNAGSSKQRKAVRALSTSDWVRAYVARVEVTLKNPSRSVLKGAENIATMPGAERSLAGNGCHRRLPAYVVASMLERIRLPLTHLVPPRPGRLA
jgi:hypothetical protein